MLINSSSITYPTPLPPIENSHISLKIENSHAELAKQLKKICFKERLKERTQPQLKRQILAETVSARDWCTVTWGQARAENEENAWPRPRQRNNQEPNRAILETRCWESGLPRIGARMTPGQSRGKSVRPSKPKRKDRKETAGPKQNIARFGSLDRPDSSLVQQRPRRARTGLSPNSGQHRATERGVDRQTVVG